jgi:hypothetical protein
MLKFHLDDQEDRERANRSSLSLFRKLLTALGKIAIRYVPNCTRPEFTIQHLHNDASQHNELAAEAVLDAPRHPPPRRHLHRLPR